MFVVIFVVNYLSINSILLSIHIVACLRCKSAFEHISKYLVVEPEAVGLVQQMESSWGKFLANRQVQYPAYLNRQHGLVRPYIHIDKKHLRMWQERTRIVQKTELIAFSFFRPFHDENQNLSGCILLEHTETKINVVNKVMEKQVF